MCLLTKLSLIGKLFLAHHKIYKAANVMVFWALSRYILATVFLYFNVCPLHCCNCCTFIRATLQQFWLHIGSQRCRSSEGGSLTTYIVSDGAAQLVHSWSCLCNFLGSADDIRCILQWTFPPEEKKWKDQSFIQYAGAHLSHEVAVYVVIFLDRGKYG